MTRSGVPTLLHGKPGLVGKAGARGLVERVVQELGGWEICVLLRCAVYYGWNELLVPTGRFAQGVCLW